MERNCTNDGNTVGDLVQSGEEKTQWGSYPCRHMDREAGLKIGRKQGAKKNGAKLFSVETMGTN